MFEKYYNNTKILNKKYNSTRLWMEGDMIVEHGGHFCLSGGSSHELLILLEIINFVVGNMI